MSVLMTLRVKGDAKAIESTDEATLQTIVERAKSHGLISHHFYGNGNEVLVVDEWPDEEACQAFMQSSPEIGQMMERAGVTASFKPDFWRHLDVNDDVG